jgi:hypothetical protein
MTVGGSVGDPRADAWFRCPRIHHDAHEDREGHEASVTASFVSLVIFAGLVMNSWQVLHS